MKLLVDTQILIWSTTAPELTPRQAQSQLEDEGNSLWFSVASLWEIAVKRSLNKPDFLIDVGPMRDSLFDAGFEELPVQASHVLCLTGLQRFHKDPFDRLLLAQAVAEGMVLLTTDRVLAKYEGPITLV